MGTYYGWVPKLKNGKKGGELRLAGEGIDENEYKKAMRYFKKHAETDVETIHRAWAEDKINGWGEYTVPGPSLSPNKEKDKKTHRHAKLYNRSQSVHELHDNNGIVTHVPL
eukprot:3094567-Rhodomonas_salina.1